MRWMCSLLVLLFLAFGQCALAGTIFYYKDENGVLHFTDIPTSSLYRPFMVFRDSYRTNREQILRLVRQSAQKHNLDHELIQAVIEVESNFQADAVSRVGAQGLMQIMPQTQRHLGLDSPFEPESNIDAGVRYLKGLIGEFKSLPLALAAYNAGPNSVKQYGGIPPYAETQNYVRKVTALYVRLKNQQ